MLFKTSIKGPTDVKNIYTGDCQTENLAEFCWPKHVVVLPPLHIPENFTPTKICQFEHYVHVDNS